MQAIVVERGIVDHGAAGREAVGALTRTQSRSVRRPHAAAPPASYRPAPFWKRFALWWHRRDLEYACSMTTEVLKQKGRLDEEVTAFLRDVPAPPFVETMAILFLERMSADRDPEVLQTAVAELELFSVPWKVA